MGYHTGYSYLIRYYRTSYRNVYKNAENKSFNIDGVLIMAKDGKQIHEHIHQETHMKIKKVGVLLIASWIFGVLFIFGGVNTLFESVFGGILIILGGVMILPPFGEFIKEKFNFELTGWLKFVLFLVLVSIGVSLPANSNDDLNFGNPKVAGIEPSDYVNIDEKTTSLPTKSETGMIATVNSASKQTIIGNCGEYSWTCNKADPGKTFLVIDVTLENKGATGFMSDYVSPSSFSLKDNDGYVYNYAYVSYLDQDFPTGEIKDGDKVRGKIAFEIPNNLDNLRLIFGDSSISLKE